MHSQFKHILILFIELVDLHNDRPNESGNTKKMRMDNLTSSMKSLISVVMKIGSNCSAGNSHNRIQKLKNYNTMNKFADSLVG